MVERSFIIIEMLAIVLCIHGLYGEKFRWNIYTILYLSLDFIGYQIGYMYDVIQEWKVIFYILLFVYIRIQFKGIWKISFINYILSIIVCFIVQLVACYPVFVLLNINSYPAKDFSVNILLISVMFILYKRKILNKIALYMQQRSRMLILILIIMVSLVITIIYVFDLNHGLEALDYYFMMGSIVLLFLLLYCLQKERWKNHQILLEKNLNSLYGNALSELIEKVRINQHNYKNQLATIQGMAYTAQSIEELRKEQEKYYQIIEKEDKYYKIISGNNDSFVAGFLYSKLCNVDTDNIQIDCSLKVNRIENILLASDIIKILGILIDNAFEEVSKEEYEKKCIDIEMIESDTLKIKVGNVCHFMNNEEIEKSFKKGYSSKGEGRGLGLYNAIEIVRHWKGSILPSNMEQEGENWFYVIVEFPKEKRP